MPTAQNPSRVSPPKHRKPIIVSKTTTGATAAGVARNHPGMQQPGGGVERRSIPKRSGKTTKRYA